MKFSLLPVLLFFQVGFLALMGHYAFKKNIIKRGELIALYGLMVLLCCWCVASGYLAYTGAYTSERFLNALPGLWLPLVPIALAILPIAFIPLLRTGILKSAQATPRPWFAYLQALRISALGTAIKTLQGAFPVAFEVFVGIPDLLFGLSALWIAHALRRGRISDRSWIIWNAVGAAIILISGLIVINMSLPGPFAVFTKPPTFLVAFAFPLALAPTATVPLFVLYNALAIIVTLRHRKA